MQDIVIKTPSMNSVIHCGKGTFEKYATKLAEKKIFIVTDSNVYKYYKELIEKTFGNAPLFIIKAGEKSKNKNTLFKILDKMVEVQLTRSATVVALGGGVVGDITGLAASLYMRGTHLVQIPTTLLAQVDSSVGGKTAVDYGKVKNAIGAFYQPEEVIIDPLFLDTLPKREIRCGLGEIIKYATLNRCIYEKLLSTSDFFDKSFLEEITAPCVQHKADCVEKDEHDLNGLRKSLNVGHTTGHALELYYGKRSHGEYVLIGLYHEMYIANRCGIICPEYKQNFEKFIKKVIGKVPCFDDIENAARLAVHDKKNKTATEISFVVPQKKYEWGEVLLPVNKYVELVKECNEFIKTGKEHVLKLTVIGKDVSQSSSPKMHKFIASHTGHEMIYDNISIPEEQFEDKIGEILDSYDGMNVTIPFKLSIIPRLKETHGAASALHSVNTVNTLRHGFSTDGAGFMLMLENENVHLECKSVLLLGAGGAGRAVAYEMIESGATVEVYDRSEESLSCLVADVPKVKALKEVLPKKYDIIINATGVGMHKSVGKTPVGEEILSLCDTAIDLIYVPEKSRFLEIAESLGKKIINGKAMLFYQAYVAQLIYYNRFGWGNDYSAEAKKLYEEYLKEGL